MRIKAINLELLYLSGIEQTDQNIYKCMLDLALKDVHNAISNGYNHIIFLLLIDGFLYKDNRLFKNVLHKLNACAKDLAFTFELMPGVAETNFITNIPVRPFDFNAWMTYQGIKYPKIQWNFHSSKFLFLGGQPARLNRIYLTYLLYKENMLEDNIYSFFPPWTNEDIEWCKNVLNISNAEYNNFIITCENTLDNLYNEAKDYAKINGDQILEKNIYNKPWLKNPAYVSIENFTNTNFSVISEGNAYAPATDYYFLTEKTWRAVAYKHPFIIVGHKEQIEYANKKGLKTFNDYFKYPNYYKISNEKEMLYQVRENIKHFQTHYKNHIRSIQNDIEHNYCIYKTTIAENFKAIKDISQEDKDEFFNHTGFQHLIRIYKHENLNE